MRWFRSLLLIITGMGLSTAAAVPSPTLSASAPAPVSANIPASVASSVASSSEMLRIRVMQAHEPEFSISGLDLKVGGLSQTGFHALRIKKGFAEGLALWTVRDRDTHDVVTQMSGNDISVDGENLRINLKAVPDHLMIESRSRRASDVIASLDIENYLKGVLPSEMPASWPLEALKAQAVAARTFALYRKGHPREGSHFDLDSDVSDQMFQHPLSSAPTSAALENVERAIRETRGETLEDSKHDVFATYFHADCGGHTEEARDVWGVGEKMGTAVDGGCPLNPRAVWSLKLSSDQVAARLAKVLKRTSGILASIRSGERTGSGRLASIKVAWSDGTLSTLAGNEFRAALGFDQLRSTQFSIQREGSNYSFRGQGYGHGVGMCQWGARQLAKAGNGYLAILKHYYPKAMLASTHQLEGARVAVKSEQKRSL